VPSSPGKSGPESRGREDKGINAILEKAARRLEEALAEETAALRSRTPIDLNAFNIRKSQGLLELDRALRLLAGAQPSEGAKAALTALRQKLDVNREILQTHLEAVREVTAIIAEAIRGVESDGTYSFSFRSKGPEP
jgi:hypothetical protein